MHTNEFVLKQEADLDVLEAMGDPWARLATAKAEARTALLPILFAGATLTADTKKLQFGDNCTVKVTESND